MAKKVIISCAVTGSIHTPSMSPYLPVTAQEIAESALGAAEAGAAIVHLHARNPEDGRPDQSPEAFEPFLKVIKQSSNVVVNLTTGGSPYMTVEERVRPAEKWKPEVASLNMGSMNFGLFPDARSATRSSNTIGSPKCWRARTISCSGTATRTFATRSTRSTPPARVMSSSATTRAISTTCTISSPRGW